MKRLVCLSPTVFLALILATPVAVAQTEIKPAFPPVTQPEPGVQAVDFAQVLWQSLKRNRLVGANTFQTVPYVGQGPHGAVVETLYGRIAVAGRSGDAIVHKNYRGLDVRPYDVINYRFKYLDSITVMFRREENYDYDNYSWFYAKFNINGSVTRDSNGIPIVGRGTDPGGATCYACHSQHRQTDFQFNLAPAIAR